ncbi:hypothetical protein [Clostridium manihotivorum]|uniref:hypothetical protein n=1 Tax=Clostridium manihotivorum TaxID=2320868 RepID=UPI0013E348B3|nr:hypothetical protein [Clostridium manihotivorum]
MELKEIMEMPEVKKAIDYVFAGFMEDEKKTKLKRHTTVLKHLLKPTKIYWNIVSFMLS